MGSESVHTISVIIPCYRQAHFLGEAIESVLGQVEERAEIVVIDDGSPDATEAVARRYPQVHYVRQDNRGLAAARNAGVRASRGEYLVFLDADDRLLAEHLRINHEGFLARPEAGLVCGDYRWFGAPGTWHVHNCQAGPDHYATLLRFNFIGPPHVAMVRRAVVEELGGFREDLRACEDWDFYIRVARRYPIYCHHRVVAEYRRHSAQMSRNWDLMLQCGIEILRAQYPYVKGAATYEAAYRCGIRHVRQLWGQPLIWDMVRAIRSGELRRAGRYLLRLARLYPQGLLALVQQKMTSMLQREKRAA